MHSQTDTQSGFEYPVGRLIPLQNIRRRLDAPSWYGRRQWWSLLVCRKERPHDRRRILSHVREYFPNQTPQTSIEWAILPYYDNNKGAFSISGDTGSVIVDGRGRYGGILSGGADKTTSSDITYATPIWWLLEDIKANGFPDAHLNLTMD